MTKPDETAATRSVALTGLLSCRCGGEAKKIEIPSQDGQHMWVAMMCNKCHQGPKGCRYSELAAERAWNEWAR